MDRAQEKSKRHVVCMGNRRQPVLKKFVTIKKVNKTKHKKRLKLKKSFIDFFL